MLLERFALPVAATLVLLLIPIELGFVGWLDTAWAFTLWRALPDPLAAGLAVATALLCLRRVRLAILAVLARIPDDGRIGWALLFALPFVLWQLRERFFVGDSQIIRFWMHTSTTLFLYPDLGASFLLQRATRLGRALELGGLDVAQALICLLGATAVAFLLRATRYLSPTRGGALAIAGLVLGNGALRIFAGHMEVYPFVLVAGAGYLWAALAFANGRCDDWLPALALGIGIWIHFQFLFLVPSLLALLAGADASRPLARNLKVWLRAGLVGAAPTLVFLLAIAATGNFDDLSTALAKLLRWSELGAGADEEVWIRFWGSQGPGTHYFFLSWGHLKYLSNAFFWLAPFTPGLLLALAIASPRAFTSTQATRFLLWASAFGLLYAGSLRPVYGPYDWDLFSLSALLLTVLAGHLLAQELSRDTAAHLFTLLIGAGLLLVAIPVLAIGIAPGAEAGPFSLEFSEPVFGDDLENAFHRLIAPWL